MHGAMCSFIFQMTGREQVYPWRQIWHRRYAPVADGWSKAEMCQELTSGLPQHAVISDWEQLAFFCKACGPPNPNDVPVGLIAIFGCK